ncbi:unnamed protein product [Cladocopium goreaui]|uniref:Adagio protein 2 n=1 Tax=Cladocopium goreaui TaxID=2562237 RepID=A0A9P1CRQ2_9DINO|nr:unnamed protein product [Cladocopium goreaui]
MPVCWSPLVIGYVVHAVTVGDYFDSFPTLESDFGQDDLYGYGSGFRDLRRGGGSAYDDYFGGSYGGFGSFGQADRKESGKDSGKDCSRIEADGIPLADLLREAAENLPQNLSETPAEILELVRFFSSQEQRKFLLTHCPQAVALSVLLEAEIEAKKTSAGRPVQDEMLKEVVSPLGEMLQLAPTLRSPYKAPPVWTGKPWGDVLNSAQHRTGVVLFPIGEQQFHVDFVSAVDWSIWANRRCRGRRDLGNLQGVPLASCLEKCSLHPSCRSATFWHWQPGGMGFDQRCFLSSSCTYQLSTDEGAEGAFLFEKLALLSVAEQDLVHERLRSPNAAWAPRAGHQLLAANSGNGIRLLLMGGIGVDPFVNTTQDEDGKKMTSQDGMGAKHDKKQKGGKGKGSAQARSAEARSRRQSNFTGMLNVVQAYLSRHVELSGELPPLRSLPYGRLGDLWMSEDEGTSWTLLQQKVPWGPRAFFGAAAVDSRLLVFGGIRTPEASNQTDDLPRQYVNDVWTASLPDLVWRELPAAPWEARAGFQALAWQPDKSGEEILLFGGRLETGDLKNDVWALRLDELDRHSDGSPAWRLVTAAASWCPRSDFASAFAGQSRSLWIFGGSGQDGRALADVWRSTDAASWFQVQAAASWGPRIGATAVTLQWQALQALQADVMNVMLLFGGYSYFDDGFGPQPGNASDKGTAWISTDGMAWSPLPPDSLAWTQGTMHAASVAAPCDMTVRSVKGQTCSYVTGGISDEGYFDNAVRRLQVGQREDDLLKSITAKPYAGDAGGVERSMTSNWTSENLTRTTPMTHFFNVKVEHAVGLSLLLSLVLLWTCVEKAAGWTDPDKSDVPPSMRCLTRLLFGMVALLFAVGGVTGTVLLSISKELATIRSEAPRCQIDDNLTSVLWHALGLAESAARWDEFEVLLRLASHESQYGYGFGYGAGGKASDIYGTRYDRGYDGYGPYDAPGPKEASSLKKELSLLPTIQSVSCRTPKCDRNATCLGASRYGCCSDYMMVMLNDITSWLKEQDIPYFITYGTLLGAVREKDILPWTQDMDIVVDRSHWPKLQQGLEAAEFFGGRRYLFGVDQWEERVSRVCADWEGFATSIVGGQESDRFSRPTDFHLDVYASDWWQITDLHLVDCVEPLGVTQLEIRGRNFSAPARPRACVEKLYGAEWRVPKRALAGVN